MCGSKCNKQTLRISCFRALILIFSSAPFFASSQNGEGLDKGLRSLGSTVNSEFDDFAPVLNLEENILFFTSDRTTQKGEKKDLNIFISERGNGGKWTEPRPLPFNTSKDEISVGISSGGQTLFLHREGDLYKVERKGKEWEDPQPMSSAVNSEHEELHGSLSSDGRSFYFVSDRDGDKDIYRVKSLPTGQWSKPKKLPSPINTSEEENAPFIHPDGQTLFFSSVGHSQEGKPDIFYSKREERGEWKEPVNMGYPISTKGRNLHLVTSADGQRAYFASRSLKEGEDRDLFRLDLQGSFTEGLAVLKGFVDVPEGSDLLDSIEIRIERPEGMEGSDRPWVQRPQSEKGVFIAVLPPCHNYKLNYYLGREKKLEDELFVPCRTSYQKLRKEVFLRPIEFDPSSLERSPSLIGRVQYASTGNPVSKGTLKVLKKGGGQADSISIGSKGEFSFYHPPEDGEELLFRLEKEGPCKNTVLELRSGGKTYQALGRDSCSYRFPSP